MSADKVTNLYKILASTPTLKEAIIGNKCAFIQSLWSQRNIDKLKTSKFLKTIVVNPTLTKSFELNPIDTSSEIVSKISSSERFRAVIREVDEKQFLEIWNKQCLFRSVDLTTLDVHGKIYSDAEFGSLKWSPDETKILYVAEKKPLQTGPFYSRKSKPKDQNDKITVGEEYYYEQDWGEQMVGKKKSVIVEYNIEEDKAEILDIPENLCPGQVNYFPDNKSIFGVTYDIHPRKLGLIYCINRPSKVFIFKEKSIKCISEEGKSVQTPILSPDGKYLLWLEGKSGGPHRASVALVKKDLTTGICSTVIEIVETETVIEKNQIFFGLFHSEFVDRCWASNNRLLLSSVQINTIKTYVVDINSKKITELPYNRGSQTLLDVKDDLVLVSRRNFLYHDVLALGKLPEVGKENEISFVELTESKKIPLLENCTYEDITLTHDNEDVVKTFSAIYIGTKTDTTAKTPLVVYPHGGPHSAFVNGFSLDISLNLSMGFAVLLVNYRGSLGFGNKTVHFLLGKVGSSDVLDCILATNIALKKYPFLDDSKLLLAGGSHGGFLVTHLSGQYPDLFKAVVARNAVTDIASMSVMSDIPDWCYVECGKEYSQKGPMTDEILIKMRNSSPIVHAHKVKAPTLLQVGSKDLRVPAYQSFEYFHRLKANGVDVQMNLYDDNHPLGILKNEMDNLINTILWFLKHTSK